MNYEDNLKMFKYFVKYIKDGLRRLQQENLSLNDKLNYLEKRFIDSLKRKFKK